MAENIRAPDGFPASLSMPAFFIFTIVLGVSKYIISLLVVAIYNLYFHPLARFPGPRLRAAFHFPDLWYLYNGTTIQTTKRLHDTYGDVVRLAPDTLSFANATAWKDIYGLKPNKRQLAKDRATYDDNEGNIIQANDADHARMRKLLSHAFSDAALREQESLMSSYFDLLVDRLKTEIDGPSQGIVDLVQWYAFTAFDIIGDLTFGESFGALERGEYHPWIGNIYKGLKFLRFTIIANHYPLIRQLLSLLSKLPALANVRNAHYGFSTARAMQRLNRKTDRKDIITYVLRHNGERGMTRDEIVSNSSILIMAGSDTSAKCLSGATFHLLKNPEILRRAQEEVRSAFSNGRDINLVSVGQLRYLPAVLNESLRVYPPAPGTFYRRTGPQGDVIDGKYVAANMAVGVHQWSANRSRKNFADPESFIPERWLESPPEKYQNDKREAMQAFSYGPRNCLGQNLAYAEMRSILARILFHFDLELCRESENWDDQDVFFLWNKPPLIVKLTLRS